MIRDPTNDHACRTGVWGGVAVWMWRRPRAWFHVGDLSNQHRILTPYGSCENTEAKNEKSINASFYRM